jgi:hypothetical protein
VARGTKLALGTIPSVVDARADIEIAGSTGFEAALPQLYG